MVRDRVHRVLERIREAEARAGRRAGETVLCAVTKTFSAALAAEAIEAGVVEIGENRVQEAVAKRPEAEAIAGAGRARWHLIGHLQANKARRAAETFDVIQTVDSVELVDRLDRIAGELGRRLQVFVQVDLGHEATKSGAHEDDLDAIVDRLAVAAHLEPAGLMTVPPFFDDVEKVRPYFRELRELRDRVNARGALASPMAGLSMGMSHDFEVAVEEGATLVRVGSALFGERG